MKYGIAQHFPEFEHDDALMRLRQQGPVFDCPVMIIAMTARTGSTNLTQVLSAIAGWGLIEESFNYRDVLPHYLKEDPDLCFQSYCRMLRLREDRNGLIFKTSWEDFRPLVEQNLVERMFPRACFVYLDRCDIEAQAVSLSVAIEKNDWHRRVSDVHDASRQLTYDKRRIDQCVVHLLREKLAWLDFFSSSRTRWLPLYYEAYASDFCNAAHQMIEFSGFLQVINDRVASPLMSMRRRETDEILKQYKLDRRGPQEGVYDV